MNGYTRRLSPDSGTGRRYPQDQAIPVNPSARQESATPPPQHVPDAPTGVDAEFCFDDDNERES